MQRRDYEKFEMHLIMEYANENLLFWNMCNQMIHSPATSRYELACEILENHIIRKCEDPINLPARLMRPLVKDLISRPPKTAAVIVAKDHVFELMIDSFARFEAKEPPKRMRQSQSVLPDLGMFKVGSLSHSPNQQLWSQSCARRSSFIHCWDFLVATRIEIERKIIFALKGSFCS